MGRKQSRDSPGAPPFVAWPTGKLVVLLVLLPLAGAAMVGWSVIQGIAALRQTTDPATPWFGLLWMLVVGLGLFLLSWPVLDEIRRRRRFPSEKEQQERRAAAEAEVALQVGRVRSAFRAGVWCFVLGAPGMIACVGARWAGDPVPDWAGILSLPLTAGAPLCWMQCMKLECGLWIMCRRPSRWLAYAAISFGVYAVAFWFVVFPFLRS